MSDSFIGSSEGKESLYKGIGAALGIGSGFLIGTSFVFKKKGLLQSTEKAGAVAGEGYAYLKSVTWWSGMILMILGEICNFVAYAFAPAILVTPIGATSVVISAILSSIFLNERLTFHGWVGCMQCIIGAVIIVLHAPATSSTDASVDGFKHLVLQMGFLIYAGVIVLISLVLIFYAGPKWGRKNMLVYIFICSLIGSISVVFTQGFGTAIVYSITVSNQFTNWFIYVMLGILVVTLILEIVYLNKALNIYNTALVTPTYYVVFTTFTIVSSVVLFQGFKASVTDIVSCVLGFTCICSGVTLLHHSSATPAKKDELDDKDIKDAGALQASGFGNVSSAQMRRNKSILSVFSKVEVEDTDDTGDNSHGRRPGEDLPGPGELFSAPFSGIGRYASTTRSKSRRQSQRRSLAKLTMAAQPDISDPDLDEKAYWSGHSDHSLSTIKEVDKPLLPTHRGDIDEPDPFTPSPTRGRRDQDQLNPVEQLRLGIIGKPSSSSSGDDDRHTLMDH
ncbi:magnesium transporter NIPA-domain-containing protein [Gongronella butleri]|nr:magnesium transporter NIPA-domain-containing protein [Gongronella butleri]